MKYPLGRWLQVAVISLGLLVSLGWHQVEFRKQIKDQVSILRDLAGPGMDQGLKEQYLIQLSMLESVVDSDAFLNLKLAEDEQQQMLKELWSDDAEQIAVQVALLTARFETLIGDLKPAKAVESKNRTPLVKKTQGVKEKKASPLVGSHGSDSDLDAAIAASLTEWTDEVRGDLDSAVEASKIQLEDTLFEAKEKLTAQLQSKLVDYYKQNEANLQSDPAHYGKRFVAERDQLFDHVSEKLGSEGTINPNLIEKLQLALVADEAFSLDTISALVLSKREEEARNKPIQFDFPGWPSAFLDRNDNNAATVPAVIPATVSQLVPVQVPAKNEDQKEAEETPKESNLETEAVVDVQALREEVAGLLKTSVSKISQWDIQKLETTKASLTQNK